MAIAQEDRSRKQGPAYSPSRPDRSRVPRSRPLIGRRTPTLDLPQNLQDGFGSGIALRHDLNGPLPDSLQPLLLHVSWSLLPGINWRGVEKPVLPGRDYRGKTVSPQLGSGVSCMAWWASLHGSGGTEHQARGMLHAGAAMLPGHRKDGLRLVFLRLWSFRSRGAAPGDVALRAEAQHLRFYHGWRRGRTPARTWPETPPGSWRP